MVRWAATALAEFLKSRASLVAENLCLRQQLLVLQRRHPRPRLRDADRRFWILACRWFSGWRRSLVIVTARNGAGLAPQGLEILLALAVPGAGSRGRRPIRGELRSLIRRMALENALVGPAADPGGAGEAGVQGLGSHRRQVHASAAWARTIVELAKLSQTARWGYLGLRLLLRPDLYGSKPSMPFS